MENDCGVLEEYKNLQKKYNLPRFEKLAEDFDIERVSEKESSFLLRDIRKVIAEKIFSYLHLFEGFLNPNSHSVFFFSLLKNLTTDIREKIKDIYDKLSKFHLDAIKLDLIYSEESESNFIKSSHQNWQEMRKEIHQIFEILEKNSAKNETILKGDYFG